MSNYKKIFRKSQLTVFFIAIIATLLIITMVTINIGKIAKDKTYTENSSDAGAIAGASVCAYAFNYVAEANEDDQDNRMEDNYNDFQDAVSGGRDAPTGVPERQGPYFRNGYQQIEDSWDWIEATQWDTYCCSGICDADFDIFWAVWEANNFILQMQALKQVIKDYADTQDKFYREIRETVHDDAAGQSDLYNNALSMCYRYNLYNSGMPVKMGEDAKEFYEWADSLTPGRVSNCSPETYNWTDAAARTHTVTATCCINPIHTYQVYLTQIPERSEIDNLLDQAIEMAESAIQWMFDASDTYAAGCPFCPCFPGLCEPFDWGGDWMMQFAGEDLEEAYNLAEQAEQGLKLGSPETSNSKTSLQSKIIAYIQDITHSRTLTSSQFQFHMGGVVKGPRLDLDTPTFYPPTQSGATSSFAGGSIHPQRASHEARLILAH
ncbi:MAG: hypothetical protein JW867_05465 [Candidatus Omnitrophica bacterium]|nr:hypothetical protein [Candidatus Omnitrophota bacterium]